jgi:hypothetical protein
MLEAEISLACACIWKTDSRHPHGPRMSIDDSSRDSSDCHARVLDPEPDGSNVASAVLILSRLRAICDHHVSTSWYVLGAAVDQENHGLVADPLHLKDWALGKWADDSLSTVAAAAVFSSQL